jgi:Na+/H+ antiporter NhaC
VSILAGTLQPELVPAAVFILSAITAFTTGTSWGTLGILMPLVVPLTWAVLGSNGIADVEHMHILYSAIACNLAGAVWGDHCSPISDTTVLSSMSSGCDHIEHVRTQMPYAMLVGAVAIAAGTIPGGYGFPPLFSILAGIGILLLVLRMFGRQADLAAGPA